MLGFPGSALLAAAERGELEAVPEGFVDRAYLPDGRLVPRTVDGALITDPDAAAEQAVRIATGGEVVTIDGTVLATSARSLCVHGDSPGAVAIAAAVRHALAAAGVDVLSFSV